jgi:uncharacterized protein (TIGR02001 family)
VEHNPSQEFYKMKKTLLAVALASSLTSFGAVAADKAPEPDFSISGNFGLFSDYRFRGMSQSDRSVAAQGGFDLTHKSGFYAGTWGSNVSDWANPAGSGLELDVYTGYSTELKGVGINVGALHYYYPGNENKSAASPASGKTASSTELYVGLSYGAFSYKYSQMISKQWFTYQANSGSYYHDLGVKIPLSDAVTLGAHYGIQEVKGNTSGLDGFTDYKVGIAYALGKDFTLSLDYVGTGDLTATEKATFFTGAGTSTKKLYESGAVISITKTF